MSSLRSLDTPSSRRLRVGFDLDGVLYPLVPAQAHYTLGFETFAGTRLGLLSGETLRAWMRRAWRGARHVLDAGAQAGRVLLDSTPEADIVPVLNQVQAAGHSVVILTARKIPILPGVAEATTRRWLQRHQIPFDELHVVTRKHNVGLDLMIEDSAVQYDTLAAQGVNVVLRDRPWNQGHPGVRIHHLGQYLDIIDALATNPANGSDPVL